MRAAVRDETGSEPQRLFMLRRDRPHQRGVVERHTVNSRRHASGNGPVMGGAIAAYGAERDRPWPPQPSPQALQENRPLWPVEMGAGRQYAREASQEWSSGTGTWGHFT